MKMISRRGRLLWLLIGMASFGLLAMTSVPTDFSRLVRESEQAVWAEVVSVRSRWTGEDKQRHLTTDVVLRVLHRVKGEGPAEVTLDFAGGELGGERQIIAGMPRFRVGDREVLFVKAQGRPICPLVGLSHGRFKVLADRVYQDDGTPLVELRQIGTKADPAVARRSGASAGMPVLEFLDLVRLEKKRLEAATR